MQEAKPRIWARFKDAVKKCPQTCAYGTAMAVSGAAAVQASYSGTSSAYTTGMIGVSFLSLLATFTSVTREIILPISKSIATKAETAISSMIAGAGFIAGSVMILAGNAWGMTVGAGSLMAAVIYKPVNDILTDTISLGMKAKKILGGALTGVGIFGVVSAMSQLGMGGLLNQIGADLSLGWKMASDGIALVAGIGLAAVGLRTMRSADSKKGFDQTN
ncbi:MAG: hypothetical protein V2A68_00145 [Candidatus Micrarchaeota archaeon]